MGPLLVGHFMVMHLKYVEPVLYKFLILVLEPFMSLKILIEVADVDAAM